MNLFILDENPTVAASYYCDKHIVKLILESAQLFCTTSWFYNVAAPYKKTHLNHPVSIWVRETIDNYNWAMKHALALCNEYTLRYNKTHKSQQIIEWCQQFGGKPIKTGLTPFAQAMPDKYKNDNAIFAYRDYYIGEKLSFAKWKEPAKIPFWIINRI